MIALRGLAIVEGQGFAMHFNPSTIVQREAHERQKTTKRAKLARVCWDEAMPIHGTVAESYLREVRHITCEAPETIRFHPNCWHGATAKRIPAMVALVDNVEGFAVHRTYLRSDGSGKAKVEPAKMMLGAVSGGAVRLTGMDGPLVVTEGIETGLSLASGLLSGPATIWAALSTSGMKALRLPERPNRLIVASDGDEAGQAAGHTLAGRAAALGWEVLMLPAPNGGDWNDFLKSKGGSK